MPAASGHSSSQLRPFRLPVSQACAPTASSSSARLSRKSVSATAIALAPMPTSTSR